MLSKYVLSLCVLVFATAAFAAEGDVVVTQTGQNSIEAVSATEVEAKVVKVDKKKRLLTLKKQSGEEVTINVDPEVQNFNQIKKGDILRVSYLESLAWELKKKNQDPIQVTEDTDLVRAAPGQKPGAMASKKITATGTVTKVDEKNHSVTVKGPKRTIVLQVPKPEVFKNIKVGDQIEATYTEALAISIDSVKK